MNGLIRTGFQAQSEELSTVNERLGRIALIPWDSETFGFPVGTYTIGAPELDAAETDELVQRFREWTQENGVAVCSCAIPAENGVWKEVLLQRLGFCFVDFALTTSLNGLQAAKLPEPRVELRDAQAADREHIEKIATESFRHGRYHADPLFPRHLADLRYRDWVRRALSGAQSRDHVYVMGDGGAVTGFYHVTIDGKISDLRLAALAPELQGTMLGFELYASTLHLLRKAGVRRVVTNISASNTGVMNVYSMLGFHFSKPEAIYHWHSAKSR